MAPLAWEFPTQTFTLKGKIPCLASMLQNRATKMAPPVELDVHHLLNWLPQQPRKLPLQFGKPLIRHALLIPQCLLRSNLQSRALSAPSQVTHLPSGISIMEPGDLRKVRNRTLQRELRTTSSLTQSSRVSSSRMGALSEDGNPSPVQNTSITPPSNSHGAVTKNHGER